MRPNQPISASFVLSGATAVRAPIPGSGLPGTMTTTGCQVIGRLIPEANADYEARAFWMGRSCMVLVSQIVQVDGRMVRRPVTQPLDPVCGPPEAEPAAEA